MGGKCVVDVENRASLQRVFSRVIVQYDAWARVGTHSAVRTLHI